MDAQEEQDLLEHLEEYGLGDSADAVLGTAMESVTLAAEEPDDYTQPGITRLGGWPDLAPEMEWPLEDEQYFSFLAQINLTDLAAYGAPLPPSGLLYFYLGRNDQTHGVEHRVVYANPDPAELQPLMWPENAEMRSPRDDFTESGHRGVFARFLSLPDAREPAIAHLDADEFDYMDMRHDWRERCDATHHGMFAWPDFMHKNTREQAAAGTGRGTADDWILLLALVYDPAVGFDFWDSGTLNILIHRDDLAAGVFSATYATIETS
ncbi:MAG: DUF1963 domain-containing protein [Candidatus Methylacidiphilales bacterium]|nr:YwqG family protein [Candidatus Methylacidiphilales bacterium]